MRISDTYIFLTLFLFAIILTQSSCTTQEVSASNEVEISNPEDTLKVNANFKLIEDFDKKPTSSLLTLAFTGDLMCHSSQYKAVFKGNDTYDFIPVFEGVKPFLSAADITVGNLETVLAGESKNYSNYPQFNTPNAYADALKDAGFDVVVTANNHTYDQREKGVLRTIKELEKRNFNVLGSYRNKREYDSIPIISKNGYRLAILPYTQFSNITLPSNKKHLFKLIDTTLVRKEIQQARQQGAEIVVVHYHWGGEYLPEPDQYQRQITEKTIALGADIIIGGHPHVLQPLKKFRTASTATLDTGIVAYSLGNFYSGQRKRYRHNGAMLWLELEKKREKYQKDSVIQLKNIAHLPTWVYYGKVANPKKNEYRIYPAQTDSVAFSPYFSLDTLDFISKTSRKLLQQSRSDSDKALRKYGVDSKHVFIDEEGRVVLK